MASINTLPIYSVLLFFSTGHAIIDPQGKSSLDSLRVVVSLRLPTDTDKHLAAGSIYHNGLWIITLRSTLIDPKTKRAHSVMVYPSYSTRLNELNRHGRKGYLSDKVFCHPYIWKTPDSATNIGLVKLRKPIPVSDDFHEPKNSTMNQFKRLKLIREDFDFVNWTGKDDIWASGWGSTQGKNSKLADESHYTYTSIGFDGSCAGKGSNYSEPYNVCLKPSKKSTTFCHGDEGGPAILFPKTRYYDQYGIILPPPNKECKWQPYLINVRIFREFIDNVVRKEPPELECRNLKCQYHGYD